MIGRRASVKASWLGLTVIAILASLALKYGKWERNAASIDKVTTSLTMPGRTEDASWGIEKSLRSIPVESSDRLITAPAPSTLAYAAGNVIDLITGESHGPINDTWGNDAFRSLSRDGRAFAVCPKGADGKRTKILLLAVSSGKQVKEIEIPPGDSTNSVVRMVFVGDRHLLVACKQTQGQCFYRYDIASNQAPLCYDSIDSDCLKTTTQDGNRSIILEDHHAYFYDMSQGKRGSELASAFFGLGTSFFPAFSPKGDEVAEFSSGCVHCWDESGGLSRSKDAKMNFPGAPYDDGLCWSPDGKAWMLAGSLLVDRETKLPLWRVSGGLVSRFLDRDHVLVDGTSVKKGMLVFPVPWKLIDAAMAAHKSGRAAFVKPDDVIQLRFNIGQVRFSTPPTVKEALLDPVTRMCKSSGFRVGDAGNLVLSIDYAEEAGKTKGLRTGFSPLAEPRGEPITDTVARLTATLTDTSRSQVVWIWKYTSGETRSISGTPNDPGVRRQVFAEVLREVALNLLPAYVPEDLAAPALPIVTELKPE